MAAPAALASEHVAADLEEYARRLVGVGLDHAFPPAALDGLFEIFVERPAHLRVVPLPIVPSLLVTAVVVPEEGWGDHPGHAGARGLHHSIDGGDLARVALRTLGVRHRLQLRLHRQDAACFGQARTLLLREEALALQAASR